MDSLEFNSNQCVLIETPQEFDGIYKFLRSAKNGISLTDFKKLNFYPKFPIYLEKAGNTIGYTSTPFCTWTGKPLQILRYETTNHQTVNNLRNNSRIV